MRMNRVVVLAAMFFGFFAIPSSFGQSTKPAVATREERNALIAKAKARMALDKKKYTADQLQECENLYQVANKNWKTPEAASTLKVMMEKYPDVNRTGCAELYLAQTSSGQDQIDRLQTAIDKFGNCWYGDGVQVGALARFFLASIDYVNNKQADGDKLLDELKKDYPDAIAHNGTLLRESAAAMQAMTAASATQPAK